MLLQEECDYEYSRGWSVADRRPIGESLTGGLDTIEHIQPVPLLIKVVIRLVASFLKTDKRLNDRKQGSIKRQSDWFPCGWRRLSGLAVPDDGSMAVSKALADVAHLSVVEGTLNQQVKAGRLCRGKPFRPVRHQEMKQGVIGCRHGTAQAGLLRFLGFARRQMRCLIQQIVMQRHSVTIST